MSLANTGQPQNAALVVGGSDVGSGNPVPVQMQGGAPTPATAATSSALEASHVLKATGGTHLSTLVQVDMTAPSGTYWVQLIAGTSTVPADGALSGGAYFLHTPREVVHANGTPDAITCDDTPQGVLFTSGLVAVLSSTQWTKTAAGGYAAFDGSVQ